MPSLGTNSQTNVTKLQRIQNAALRVSTGHTKDTNARHYHEETKVLPLDAHMRMLTSQYREGCKDLEHPLHDALHAPAPDRTMKRTALETSYATCVHGCDREGEGERDRKQNIKTLHTDAVQSFLASRDEHPLL